MKSRLTIAGTLLLLGLWWGTSSPTANQTEGAAKKEVSATPSKEQLKLNALSEYRKEAHNHKISFRNVENQLRDTNQKIASAKQILQEQQRLLEEIDSLEDLYDHGKISVEDYLRERADILRKIH